MINISKDLLTSLIGLAVEALTVRETGDDPEDTPSIIALHRETIDQAEAVLRTEISDVTRIGQLASALDAYGLATGSHTDKMAEAIRCTDVPRGLEAPRMLVLSTSHITRHTNDLFQMMTDDVPLFFTKDTRGDPGDNVGWIIPIVGDEPFPHTCPADLLAIRELAEHIGATWIMLDRDADTVTGLPTYEW